MYYAWRDFNPPVYNATFGGDPIDIGGQTIPRGFGCKSKTAFMFAGTEKADRLRGMVALDPAYRGEHEGRFRIYNEDFFGNRVIWDSGAMTKDTPARSFEVELEGYRCIMFTFEGRNPATGKRADDIFGVFVDPRIIVDGE